MPEASNRYTAQGAGFSQTPAEIEHLAAARAGDANHFSELAEPYRRELQAHCYRLLGSLHEAEDMVQETYLRAPGSALTAMRPGRHSEHGSTRSLRTRAWTHWTNAGASDSCRTRLARHLIHMRLLPTSPADIAWLEPYPDEWLVDQARSQSGGALRESESISLSFLAALQVLPPRQRAALILSDVLDFSSREVAELLGLTVPAVSSALHRARATLNQNYHGGEPEGSLRSPANERTRWLLERFAHAWESADIDGLVNLLKEDATLAMPPSPSWYQGTLCNCGVYRSNPICRRRRRVRGQGGRALAAAARPSQSRASLCRISAHRGWEVCGIRNSSPRGRPGRSCGNHELHRSHFGGEVRPSAYIGRLMLV